MNLIWVAGGPISGDPGPGSSDGGRGGPESRSRVHTGGRPRGWGEEVEVKGNLVDVRNRRTIQDPLLGTRGLVRSREDTHEGLEEGSP